jgi:AcrR family transcriptional regulator
MLDFSLLTTKLGNVKEEKSFQVSCTNKKYAIPLRPFSAKKVLTNDNNMQTDEQKDEQKVLIIKLATERFKQYGIRSVSVDDLCRELSISKKTFYKYFDNKETLVEAVLEQIKMSAQCLSEKFLKGKTTVECIRALMEMHKKVNLVHKMPPFDFDLEKYYPQLYKQYIEGIHSGIRIMLEQHLKQGVEEGIYRADIDVEIYAILYSMMQYAIMRNEDNVRTLNPSRLFRTFFDSFFRSILSEEGMKAVRELWKKN